MENLEKIKNKKFLLVGSNFPFSIEKSYLRSFQNLNIKKVSFFSPDNNIILKMINMVNNKIIRKFYYYLYRLFLTKFLTLSVQYDYIIIFKGIELNLDTLKKLSRFQKKAKWINIYTDNPFNLKFASCSNPDVIKSINFYDYFCTSFSKKLNKELKKNKVKKHIYLPFGYDNYLHFIKKKIYKNKIKPKINFIGAYDEYRKNYLNKLNMKIDVFGPGWSKAKSLNNLLKIDSKFLSGKELIKIYRNYAVSLNILREQDKDSHNMKIFEIPIMGGLMLTERNRESQKFFYENKECLMYSNLNEAKSKINFMIKNSEKLSKVRKRGFIKSKKYSYNNRLKYLISVLR